MKIETMKATDRLTTIDGVPCRLWLAKTGGGVPIGVYVARIEARADDNQERLEREMVEHLPPGKHAPLELVL